MIITRKQIPSYYTRESRDFQLLAHLFDAAFNSSKTAIDAFDPTSRTTIDDKFLNLAARTVGFFNKRNYDAKSMSFVIKYFKHLVRNKGKRSAIEDAIKLLLNSQDIDSPYILNIYDNNIQLYLPEKTQSTLLLEELFEYILPAGFTYNIYLQNVSEPTPYDMKLKTSDTISSIRFVKDATDGLNGLGVIETIVTDKTKKLPDLTDEGFYKYDENGDIIFKDVAYNEMESTPAVNIGKVVGTVERSE